MKQPMINRLCVIQLSNRAFWDVDMAKLDYEKQADYIIKKVFEHGTWNDILEVVVCYTTPRVSEVLLNASYLKENTLYFSSMLLNVPVSKFKCYTTKQFHPVQ